MSADQETPEAEAWLHLVRSEPEPIRKPHFRESVAGVGYSTVTAIRMVQGQKDAERQWLDKHPEWSSWASHNHPGRRLTNFDHTTD